MEFPFPVVVCDVGGTNCRVAVRDTPDDPLTVIAHQRTADYPGLGEAVAAAVATRTVPPRSLIACGAGPVEGRRLKLTNAPWLIDGPSIAALLGLSQGLLLNDFEAQALTLPALRPDWLLRIGPHLAPDAGGTQVILGPGTGLGVGGLLTTGGRYVPLASEACHIGFAPETEEEARIWPFLERAHGRITTESVLSGIGLARLHRARLAADGKPAPAVTPAAVTAAALADAGSEEAQTIRAYWPLVARFAGDMAITFKATGGVTLSGGILPRITGLLDHDAFRAAFESKVPVQDLARRIGTALVVRDDVVLDGMAALAADPDAYALDYEGLAWC